MPDWSKSMEQSFEFYEVNPESLADLKRLENVKAASFNRDGETDTLGSATIDITNSLGEMYMRVYLKTVQNGVDEKFPLGTVLAQTPSSSFNGTSLNISIDAYTPLIELKEKRPPLGYSIRKGTNIMAAAYALVKENTRVPVNGVENSKTLQLDFVANTSDTWLTFIIDLIANADYELGLDELGHILFLPKQEIESLQAVWTYNDDNSSILYPELTLKHDLYGIPNVVEVVYSYGSKYQHVVVKNDDPNSPTSTVNRGREIVYRETDPKLAGYVSDDRLEDYAERLLKELSTVEYSVSYTHAYCPVRVGDCVRLNYSKAGINNVKAKVISQNIKCVPGCPVSEKAVFTTKLWR